MRAAAHLAGTRRAGRLAAVLRLQFVPRTAEVVAGLVVGGVQPQRFLEVRYRLGGQPLEQEHVAGVVVGVG